MNHYKLRKWSIKVRRRDKVCAVCGSRQKGEAHHLNDKHHHPRQAYILRNGKRLCNYHHREFHTQFMAGFHKKCTARDFRAYLRLKRNEGI